MTTLEIREEIRAVKSRLSQPGLTSTEIIGLTCALIALQDSLIARLEAEEYALPMAA